MEESIKVTEMYTCLPGQKYLSVLPEEPAKALLNTVLGSLYDGTRRHVELPGGVRIPVPILSWDDVNPEEMLDQVSTDSRGNPLYTELGTVIRVPSVHTNFNTLIELLNKGELDVSATLGRILVDTCKIAKREIVNRGLSWFVSPAVRGHLVRCDDLADDEVGISPEDMKRLDWRTGDHARGLRYPVAKSTAVTPHIVRVLPGLGGGVAFNSYVIKIVKQGDVDGDGGTVFKDATDKHKRTQRDDAVFTERWSEFSSTGSILNSFRVAPDPIEATLAKRQKSFVGAGTHAIWMVARAQALLTGNPVKAYKKAYDLGGITLELAFDARKGDQPIPFDMEAFTRALYGRGELPIEMLRLNGIDPTFYQKLLARTGGNIFPFCSRSAVFNCFVIAANNPGEIERFLQFFAATGKPWNEAMNVIREDLKVKKVALTESSIKGETLIL